MFVKFRPVIFPDHIPLFNLFGNNVLKVGFCNHYMSIDPSHLLHICLSTGVSIDKYINSFLSKLFKDLKLATLYQDCSNCFACNLFFLYGESIKNTFYQKLLVGFENNLAEIVLWLLSIK